MLFYCYWRVRVNTRKFPAPSTVSENGTNLFPGDCQLFLESMTPLTYWLLPWFRVCRLLLAQLLTLFCTAFTVPGWIRMKKENNVVLQIEYKGLNMWVTTRFWEKWNKITYWGKKACRIQHSQGRGKLCITHLNR